MNAPIESQLGAYLLAVGELGADLETARAIARLLGLDVAVDAASEAEQVPELARPQAPPRHEPPAPAPAEDTPDAPDVSQPLPRQAISPARTTAHRPVDVTEISGPDAAPVPTAAPMGALPAWTGGVLPFEPLLRPTAARAMLGAAISTAAAGGVDPARLVDRIARKRPLDPVPRLIRPTLARGARVMVDRGGGMAQFARDADGVVAEVHAVAGRERTEVLRFWHSPLRVGSSPRTGKPAPLPEGGRPVLALSDLGLAPSDTAPHGLARDWLAFAEAIAGAGSALVVLVPYPAARWPAALAERLTLVPWDRTTKLADVLRALDRRGRQ